MGSKKQLIIGIAAAGGLLAVYGAGAIRWVELSSERARLQAEISALRVDNQKLYEEARRLREDPAYAEAVARRELGFVRPGETKIKFTSSRPKEPGD